MKQLLHESIVFVNKAHKGQLRKGTDIDYVSHPMEVMQILTAMRADDNLIIAGVLHETVENTDVTLKDIEEKFGSEVASLVAHYNEDKAKEWHERKSDVIDSLRKSDRRIKMMVLADKVSNLRSMYGNYLEVGDELWERFNASREMQCWYYSAVRNALWELGEYEETSPIYEEMVNLFKDLFVSYNIDREAGVLFQISDTETYILTKGFPNWELTDEEPSVFTEDISREDAEKLEESWNAIFWDKCEDDLGDWECVLFDTEIQNAKLVMKDYMLSFEGHDIGLGCNIITGEDEYKYYACLDEAESYEFICQVRMEGGIEKDFSLLLQEKFEGQDAFAKFVEFCKEKNVKYVFYSV